MYQYHAITVSNYDADTLRFDIDLGFGNWTKSQPVRVYGIDAPELSTPEGKAARDFVRALLPSGSKVVLSTFRDTREKYGRYLGKITLADGSDLAERLIAANHAKPYFGGARPILAP